MADLDTCFFCARTGDVTLDEYDVIPEMINPMPEQQRTVVLCGVCSSKLDLILETVLAAVDDHGTESAALDDHADTRDIERQVQQTDPSEQPSAESSETFQITDEAEPSADGQELHTDEPEPIFGNTTESTAPDGSETQQSDENQPPADGNRGSHDAAPPESDSSRESAPQDVDGTAGGVPPGSETSSETDGSGSTTGEHTASAGGIEGDLDGIQFDSQPDESASAPATDDAPSDGKRHQSDEPDDSASDSREEPEAADTAAEDGSAGDDTDVDIDAKTYKRVIRLLRNRDLPMDRTEFEELATSAYEIEQSECAAALDAAIERDLLVEADGQLDRA